MRTIASWLGVLFLSLASHAQVLTAFEVNDPGARRVQQRYQAQLNAIGDELRSHKFPYALYFNRQLDVDEKQQRKLDQRSIHFDKFDGQTVLEFTANYYAAYSATLMDQRSRVKRTYEDVVLPILKIGVLKFPPDDDFAAFALEISYHVRRKVMGIMDENPENVTFIVPRAAAHRLVTAKNVEQEQAALLDSQVFLNAEPFLLWLTGEPLAEVAAKRSRKPGTVQVASLAAPAATSEPPAAPAPAVSQSLLKPNSLPVRLITPATISSLEATHKATIARMVKNLDAQAHFASYAPPVFVGFHQGAYLELSLSSHLTTAKGSRYQLAALAFDDHIAHLIRPVLAYFQEDGDFDGISFSTVLKLPDGNNTEAVEFFFPFQDLRCFASYDCTGQQLIDGGIVLINGERAGLSLERAEAQSRN